MGYTTTFTGKLEFTDAVKPKMLALIKSVEFADLRELDPTYEDDHDVSYLQFRITDDFSGIEWDGSEKWYGAVACVNWLIAFVRREFPKFSLKGQMCAQGEDAADRWILRMVDGVATKVETPPTGRTVECPDCGATFYPDDKGR